MNKTRTCLYCGKSFTYSSHHTHRKYCSRQCGSIATYNRRHPDSPHARVWGHDKNIFEEAMEQYWNGEGSGAIARRLNIPVGTIYSWVHDYGNQRKRKEPLKKLLQTAKSSEEWLNALRENTVDDTFENMSVHLVCGMVHGQSVTKFTNIIYESLNDNPLSGNIYAFCNKTRTTITTITTFTWKPPVFNISKSIRMYGTYIWPTEDLR